MAIIVNAVKVILYDANGVAMAVENGVATPANTRGVIVAGVEGSNTRFMKVAADGAVQVDVESSALPAGAAQEHTTAGSPHSTRLSDGSAFYDATKTGQLPSALTGSGNLKAAVVEAIAAGSNLIGKFQLRNPGNTVDLGDAANPVRTDPTGTTIQPTSLPGVVDANNSTTTPLGSSGVYTGTATDVLNYASIAILLDSDKASAADGAEIHFSNDGTNWDDASFFTFTPGSPPSEGRAFVVGTRGRYVRVKYTNTSSAQTYFRLQTVLRQVPLSSTFVRMADQPGDSNYGSLTKSVIAGHTTAGGGSYVDVKVTPSGALSVEAAQGAAAALSGAWPVKHTDGTNTMPTMDAVGRAGFQKLTDGTNVTAVKAASTAAVASDPSAVVALSPNTPLPAGSNTIGKADQGVPNTAANRWPVQHTDGTNFLPTMDVAARAGFFKLTDGTNTHPTADVAARASFTKVTDGTDVLEIHATGEGRTVLYDGSGNPVATATTHPTGSERGLVVRDIEVTKATYRAVFDRIAPAANKYMATLFNTSSTRKVVIQRIWCTNTQEATATGSLLNQEIRRITARTAGTSVTPVADDSSDTLSSGIAADHASTSVTDDALLHRFLVTNEEQFISSNAFMIGGRSILANGLEYVRQPGERGWTLRENQGISIKNITSDTDGSCSYIIEFTDEAA